MTMLSATWISVMERGWTWEKGRVTASVESYARVAIALGMTAKEWAAAAEGGRYSPEQQRRLWAIAEELVRRAPTPTMLTVDEVVARMESLRRECTDSVFDEALRLMGVRGGR